jgi:hypothetical protein
MPNDQSRIWRQGTKLMIGFAPGGEARKGRFVACQHLDQLIE